MIYVKCEKCSHEFPSQLIQTDKQTYKTMTISSNFEQCPNCGKPTLVDNSTTSFK